MTRPTRTLWLLIGGILFLTVYGSLYPLSSWRTPDSSLLAQFFTRTDRLSFGDLATNLVIYIPFGFVLAQLGAGSRPLRAVLLATLAGLMLSALMETLQAFLPQRVSSVYDFALNGIGAAIGAAIGISLYSTTALGRQLNALRLRHCRDDIEARIGLVVLALWAAANLMPFIPSLDVGQIRQGFKPIWLTLHQEAPFDIGAAVSYLCAALAAAAVAFRVWLPRRGRMLKSVLFVFAVLLLKGFIVSRQVTLEALLGAAVGLSLFRLLSRLEILAARAISGVGIVLMLLVDGMKANPERIGTLYPFNWIPFRGHLQHTLTGVQDLAGDIWPHAALAFLLIAQWRARRKLVLPLGLLAVLALTFVIEWRQQYIPDRLADITDVLIAGVAFTLPWLLLPALRADEQGRRPSRSKAIRYGKPKRGQGRSRHPVLPAILTLVAALGGGSWLTLSSPMMVVEPALDETTLAQLPEGKDLPPVKFEHFKQPHPRLPAPSPQDLDTIRLHNAQYVKFQLKRAKGNAGDLEAAIFSEFATPGSIDLNALHRRLLGLQFVYRGNEQTKPLALAYDWLYDRWTPAQRDALLQKTLDGCESQIKVIREQRLSPYNVFLYNSPLQALMACAIATYGEAPRADPVMRFTHDYWLQRVLPVWRQIMGAHGGWHEGGEYVGIGIGQAIYQLPAMWRAATGEDFFKSEPGLRGFLDFLVYRQRPDNTYFRWGDAGFFDRQATDRLALAIEYRHAVAYSLYKCPTRMQPTSWPWGPLPDPSLCDPDAQSRLPRSALFDGIGMLVSRSDWTADATLVSFKAGDNYWSHTHLDQGAFTIFKRFPLAIDSGVYGTRYGSDHHMNYTYQTVAHNALTVTDPEDLVQAPSKDGARYIANDGGQRRVGSGWGIEAAPLDYDEWMLKSETYRTGSILQQDQTPTFDAIVAELTAAYTNQWSGKGLFSSRTRRVNSYQRSFAYDREADLVIVYDRVAVEKPDFHVRWLLHTEAKPTKRKGGFDIAMESHANEPQLGRAGLRAFTPAPADQHIIVVGGPGYEFFVDGKNYDENGDVQRMVNGKKLREAGGWRIELESGAQDFRHEFLVFLAPWIDAPPADLDVQCSTGAKYYLCAMIRNGKTANFRIQRDSGRIERLAADASASP